MSRTADRVQLQRVAAGEVGAGARSNATLDRLELRGLIERWPDAPVKLTPAGRAELQRMTTQDLACAVCGLPESDHRQGAYWRLDAAPKPGTVDFDGYFTVKGFKNGNGHCTFMRPDLVDKMNQIIGRHFPGALPPSREP